MALNRSPFQSQRVQCRRSALSLRPLPTLHRQVTSRRTKSWVIDSASTAQSERLAVDQDISVIGDEAHRPAATIEPSPSPSCSGGFPWTSHWYPVAVLDDLDPRRPHATHLLGISLALWRDQRGAWHAVEDKCPHRLAPLSEGRIESDGSLQCAYHGWQFDGTGACTHIPQLRGDDKAQRVACASRRACVRSFPVQVAHGLLWVRPDSAQRAHDEFARDPTPPQNAVTELLGGPGYEGYRQTTAWFMRDVPMRIDTLLENVMDPSHVPFAHHKVQGNRNNEKGTTTRLRGEVTREGLEFELDMQVPRFGVSVPKFVAPNFIRYGNPIRSMNVYAVPTRPGWSRIYVTFMKDTRAPSRLPWLVDKVFGLVESTTWLEHIMQRHPVLDGDNYILHMQERALHEAHGGDWRGSFFMPAPADSSVIAIREWFDKYGGVVPTCEPGTALPPQLTKREALDRYSQHTVHCRHCQKALRNVDLATVLAAAAGVVAAVWLLGRTLLPLLAGAGVAAGGQPLPSAAATGLGLAAAAAAGAAVAGLRALRRQFFFVDYVHAERH